MLEYYNEQVYWTKINHFYPINRQLTDSNLPDEYYIKWNNIDIHVDHYKVLKPKGTIIAFHGIGGNGRLLSGIILPLIKNGYEVICPDLPLYGNTFIKKGVNVIYDMWIECGKFLVEYFQNQNKKISLFGFSAGGMVAYQVACETKDIVSLLATCLLDQRVSIINRKTARSQTIAKAGKMCLPLIVNISPNYKLSMKLVSNMKSILNNDKLVKTLLNDRKSSGVKVPVAFIGTMLKPKITIEPETFNKCPILLVHPKNDRWTDVSLSKIFFDRLKGDKRIETIDGCGHFPIEKEGLEKMDEICLNFLNSYYQ